MSVKTASRIALGAVAALVLGAGSAAAEPPEVSGVKISAPAATSVRINVTGLDRVAVRRLVRVAATDVCAAAARIDQLDYFDTDRCENATLDRTMSRYVRLHRAYAGRPIAGSDLIVVASR